MLANALAYLTRQIESYASQPIVYEAEGDMIESVAMLGSKLLKVDDGMGGFRIEWTDLDFLIPAHTLVRPYESQPLIPKRGHVIHVVMPYDTQDFEVLPFGNGNEPAWRWSDPHQTMYRIHTKLITVNDFS